MAVKNYFKSARQAWAVAGAIGAVIGIVWMAFASRSFTTPTRASVPASQGPKDLSIRVNPVDLPTAPKVVTANDPATVPPKAGGKPLTGTIQEAFQSANYRQYVHQALANPTPVSIRAAWELTTHCRYLAQTPKLKEVAKFKLSPSLQAELERRKAGCEQGGGPDFQQLKALSATIARHFDAADEFLSGRPNKGSLEDLATLRRVGDASGMGSWGLIAERDNLPVFAGEEPLLAAHADGAASAAWQAAICERFSCDDFNARIVRCRDDASCQMSLQDILKESSGVDDATWLQLLAAARRRRDALLPG